MPPRETPVEGAGRVVPQARPSGPDLSTGGVGDGARDDPLDHRSEPALGKARARAAGLQAHEPAVGGGDADRAAAVACAIGNIAAAR